MDHETALQNVQKAHPGAVVRSVVQAYAYLEEFGEGIKAYRQLAEPTAEDDRWLGVCYFQSFDDVRAQKSLERAVSRGCDAARVNLAHLFRATDRAERASDELVKVDFARLTEYDRVFFLRVKSIHEETNGNLREALRFAEEAWRRLQGQPEFTLLAPSILAQLGILHGRIGRAQRATWFLERGMESTSGLPQLKVKIRWATVMVAQGNLDEASTAIAQVDSTSIPGPLRVELAWLRAEIAWAREETGDAVRQYAEAIDLAEQHQAGYEEFLSRLAIATILAFEGCNESRPHMQRAQQLISDRSDQLAYRFREVLVLRQQGEYSAEHAARELSTISDAFGEMGLLQEQGNVRIHLCGLKFELDDAGYKEDLEALLALAATLQNPHFFDRELQFVPQLKKHLLQSA